MFVEERIYTLHPGKTGSFLKIYEEEAMTVQLRHLPDMLGYYSTEIGTLNQVTHLWAFDDINQRVERRDRMMADPDWQAVLPKLLTLIERQESRILRPAPFFAERLKRLVQTE